MRRETTQVHELTELTELAHLEPYRERWGELLATTPHASFFQSIDWLTSRWRHAPTSERMRVIVTGDAARPTGFVPLCVKREMTRSGPVRVLTFPIDGWGSFYGPISASPGETLREALAHIWRRPRDFDLVDLRSLAVTDDDETNAVAGNKLDEFSQVAMLDLVGDWESYWLSRNKQKNRRRNVERCERRLADLGEIRYERYRPGGAVAGDCDPRWDLYDACERLARTSWQDGLVDGNTLHHEHVRPFLRDAHVAAVNAGAVDINLLYSSDRPVAFVYAYQYRGYVDLMRIGFDPEFAKLAPGNALWTRLIRDSFARGDRVLDFGPTCLDYKRFWMSRLEPTFHIVQYSRSPRAQALRFARWVKSPTKREQDESNQQNKAIVLENQRQAEAAHADA